MKTHVLISLLLVCAATALPFPEELQASGAQARRASSSSSLHVLDEQDKPISLNVKSGENENESATEKDLHNRVFFYFYTRNTANNPVIVPINDVNSLRRSGFNAGKPTKIVIHGWMNSYRSKINTLLRNAYFQNSDCNVIVVDWGSIAHNEYFWTARRVVMVGQYVSKMLNFLGSQGVDMSNVTIAGHSLGAHVAGLASYYANRKVKYVIAMDPALPNFSNADMGHRVSRGDASYVEVIHTSAGLLGYKNAIGDSDFYLNDGTFQPGCNIDLGSSCSHSRSYEYYAESINSNTFIGVACNSYDNFRSGSCNSHATANMGGIAPNVNVRGVYYVRTNSHSPFGTGHA